MRSGVTAQRITGRRISLPWRSAAITASSVLVGVALWAVASHGLQSPLFPSPLAIIQAGLKLLLDGSLVKDTAVSLQRIAIGFGLGCAVGIPLGLAMGLFKPVHVVFDPGKVSYETLLKSFWENHDPTQGMRQGNDVGTQYRSAIYTRSAEHKRAAESSRAAYQDRLTAAGYGRITTEIADAPPFYYAEEYHQQYLAKNPGGYCGIGGTGVSCPLGVRT